MSLNGLLVRSPVMLLPGTEVELSVIPPTTSAAIKATAKILRVADKNQLAILFQEMRQDQREALQQFMLPLILAKIGHES